MNHGELVMSHPTKEVFARYKELESMQLAAPQVTYIMHALRHQGLNVDATCDKVQEAKESILKAVNQFEKKIQMGQTND